MSVIVLLDEVSNETREIVTTDDRAKNPMITSRVEAR
jgi:hypothetical protein